MTLLLAVLLPAQACSPSVQPWSLPVDGARHVPTNALVYVADYGSEHTLLRTSDGAVVPTTPVETTWSIDWAPSMRVLRPEVPLDPLTEYAVESDLAPVAAFTTGDGPTAGPPAPPTVEGIEHAQRFSLYSCGPAWFADFQLAGDGALLLVDPGLGADVDPSDPFAEYRVFAARIGDGTTTWSVEQDNAAARYRFGTIDQAGSWSGWGPEIETPPPMPGPPVDTGDPTSPRGGDRLGCGCGASGGPAGSAGIGLLAVVRRRRARSAERIAELEARLHTRHAARDHRSRAVERREANRAGGDRGRTGRRGRGSDPTPPL